MTTRSVGRIGAVAVAVLVAMACPASADFIVNVSSATVLPGQGGYLDVYITNPTDGDDLAAYQVTLDVFKNVLGDQSDVKFSVLSNAVTNPIFPSNTPYSYGGNTLPNTHLASAADISSGGNLITNNAGIIRVQFTTSASSSGVYKVNFDLDPVRTSFTNSDGYDLSQEVGRNISFVTGTITVTPEPSTLVLLAIGLVGMVYAWRKRK